jgi:hypothetical protein
MSFTPPGFDLDRVTAICMSQASATCCGELPHAATHQARARDARNDLRLADADWRVIRIPWKDLKRDPKRVVAITARAVARAAELVAR